ncbi:MAG TPA: ABC transporter ATP-binding protein [Planctomycetaceae bacterium]|nr:ABC transporter ATP-binding protein [Planctomycetaceae bacterium]
MTAVPEATPVADFEGVTKWYGPVIGVNDVRVAIYPGVTGLVGTNGAGKTTLIKLLTGHLRPTLGQVRVGPHESWSAAAKRQIGYCPEVDTLYEEMTGRSFLTTMARLQGWTGSELTDRVDQVLKQVGMFDRAHRRLKGCSKGMRQRIKLGQALIHDPNLIVVDEPLNGVDPVGRLELMDLFRALAERGKAVLVSSHILGEMDDFAERVIFMGRGRVLAVGTLGEIRALFADMPLQVRVICPQARALAKELMLCESVQGVTIARSDELSLEVVHAAVLFRQLAELAAGGQFEIQRLETTDVTTEATFGYVMSAAAQF